MPNAILELRNVHVEVEGKRIIKGVSLGLRRGSIHAIMGPNGSGKSTLAYAIAGRPGYNVVEGDILLEGKSILGMEPEERALAGIFLAFQDPPPLPGVKFSVLAVALSNKKAGLEDLSRPGDPKIYKKIASILEAVGLSPAYASRELHVGFSGGEKKRAEIAQLLLLDPKVVILDEPDSGLDVDGVRQVASIISRLRDEGKAVMLITHYARIFQFVKPDEVTVLVDGRVADKGGPELAHRIEAEGYSRYTSNNRAGR